MVLFGVFFLGFRSGFLCILRGTSRFSCVLRGALRFFDIYNITYKIKKKKKKTKEVKFKYF
jgi:hypothetical protein